MAATNCLADTKIMVTGYLNAEREEASVLIKSMGGELLSVFSQGDPPHVLVSSTVLSEKYRVSRLALNYKPS